MIVPIDAEGKHPMTGDSSERDRALLRSRGDGALAKGDLRLPIDAQGRFLLKFRGPARSHRRFAAANLIQSEIRLRHGQEPFHQPPDFKDKWVLVGLIAPGLLDLKASPVSPIYPGVELHATLLDNLIQRDFLRPAPSWFLWLWTAALAGGVALAVFFTSGLAAPLVAFVLAVAFLVGLTVFLFWVSWWSDPLLAGVALASSFGLAAVYSYATEGRQRQAIRCRYGVARRAGTLFDVFSEGPRGVFQTRKPYIMGNKQ